MKVTFQLKVSAPTSWTQLDIMNFKLLQNQQVWTPLKPRLIYQNRTWNQPFCSLYPSRKPNLWTCSDRNLEKLNFKPFQTQISTWILILMKNNPGALWYHVPQGKSLLDHIWGKIDFKAACFELNKILKNVTFKSV